MHAKFSGLLVLGLLLSGFLSSTAVANTATLPKVYDAPVDLVVVVKSERMLYLYASGIVVESFPIGLGKQPIGHKRQSGDSRTPEGAYVLDWRNPDSLFNRSIHISYPNAEDIAWAEANGVDPGGAIMIHGEPTYDSNGRSGDWTDGCIALSDQDMNTLWRVVPTGTPIHIYP